MGAEIVDEVGKVVAERRLAPLLAKLLDEIDGLAGLP
jgi:hypothetical protein